jgi:hypothetical protein
MSPNAQQDADLSPGGLDAVVDEHATLADEPRFVVVGAQQELVLVHTDITIHHPPTDAGHVEDAAAE